MHLLIIGTGDIGARVAALAGAAGHQVTATGRRAADAAEPLPAGCTRLAIDLDRPATLAALPATDATLLYLAPPPATGVTDPRVRALCAALAAAGSRPRRLVYASTTGVYGDCAGARIDETRPPHPQTDRARRRLDAEETLRDYAAANDIPLVILRIAGIYGPGRLPLQRLAAGMSMLRPEDSPWSNRIHADDLAAVCLAACERGAAGAIYNVCDGEESRMSDYFLAVARAFALPAPRLLDRREASAALSPEMLSYLAESRRIDNRRLRDELGVTLRYPTLASGLAALRMTENKD